MGRLQSLIYLEAVSTRDLRLPCKVIAYFNLVLYAFCALVMHIFGILAALTSDSFHPRRLLYGKQVIRYDVGLGTWTLCILCGSNSPLSFMLTSFIVDQTKEIEESWMVCRAVFSYFVLRGVREENPAFVLPILLDAITQILAAVIFIILEPFTHQGELPLKKIVQIVLGFLLDSTLIIIVGNYYRRLRMGNLEAESEQPGA